jgi:sugar phosphate isomerase/epimerase
MQRVVSTYRYVNQPLSAAMLAEIAQTGATSVEVFCAAGHFDYRSQEAVRGLADILSEHQLELHSLHAPTERGSTAQRDSGVSISISETERIRRIDAVDEIKRALEVAERLPFRYFIQHLAHGRQASDPRKLDAAFSALEHLTVFAKARGATIAIENTPGELTSPMTIQHFIEDTHLHDLKLCFDIGHAHIEDGVDASFETMRSRVVTTHIHDNHGDKDQHLVPYEGTIDWDKALSAIADVDEPLPIVLELKEQSANNPALDEMRAAFDKLEKGLEGRRPRATRS